VKPRVFFAGAVFFAGIAALVMLSGCGADGRTGPLPATPESRPGVALPPAGAAFDYQLGGAYEPPEGATVVVRDSTAAPADGLYSICYINGFQTQPGAEWPGDLLLRDDAGAPVADPDWPDEVLLDISTADKRERIAARHAETIAGCAAAGFAAVEFDNLDSYTRSGGALTLEDAIAFSTLLVELAHQHGLAAAQKNTAELGARGRDEIGFDFAITEECDRWDECAVYTDVYGERVLNIEYTDDLRGSADDVCARPATPASTIIRDRQLVPADAPGYAYRRC
jgi:Glycoside-hydrolase family GH114